MFTLFHGVPAWSGRLLARSLAVVGLFLTVASAPAADGTPARPLRALLITGGCCHNYPLQAESLTNAVARHARCNATATWATGW